MDSRLHDAQEAIEVGEIRKAQALAADVLKEDQKNGEAWYLLSETMSGERQLSYLRKAIQLNPELVAAQMRLAQLEGREAELLQEPEPVEAEREPLDILPSPEEQGEVDEDEIIEEPAEEAAVLPPSEETSATDLATQDEKVAEKTAENGGLLNLDLVFAIIVGLIIVYVLWQFLQSILVAF